MDYSGDNTRMDPLRQTSVTPPDKISSVLDDPDGRSLMIRHTLLVVLCAPLFAQTVDNGFLRIQDSTGAGCKVLWLSLIEAACSDGSTYVGHQGRCGERRGDRSCDRSRKPAESKLFKALTYTDPHLHMPPSGKLPDAVIADFEQWIAGGAPDPRAEAPATSAALKGMSVDEGRKWWAFQPLPKPAATTKARDAIDSFIRAKLKAKGLKPSSPADARTLARRAYVDLVGYKPTYEEVGAFANDNSPDAYEKLVDKLLASERYGERWGRHWMDVARFGEDNPTGEATNPPYPYAWRYRDWIIEAINKDVPYDRFVKLQLAADLMANATRDDLRALGYLGAAPVYHKDLRLSEQVIGGFLTDDWDERVDAVSRGLLGLTVACARCHDHKFDPIPTKDYYGLVGVFASTMRTERPLFDVDPKVEARYSWLVNRLFDLKYSINLLTNEASTVVDSAARVAKWKVGLEELKEEALKLKEQYPKLVQNLEKHWTFPPPRPPNPARRRRSQVIHRRLMLLRRQRPGEPETAWSLQPSHLPTQSMKPPSTSMAAIPNSPSFTTRPVNRGTFPVLRAGNVASPGEIVPRHFPLVLARGDANFKMGSGRLELAEKIFTDAAPLSARIIVNRVWNWHIGKPIVATPSDFGVQGEKPTHPELLDDLAARFIANGWSLKWLNREIMLSATYRQSSKLREDAAKVDTVNALVWRMNPRRMDIESYRDTLLRASGRLNEKMYGPSEDLQSENNVRRTVYGRVSRGRMSSLLKTYDFPDPMQTAGGRELTITPLQQLFVMNSPFMHEAAVALAGTVAQEPDDTAKMRALFRKVLSREPSPKELDMALSYLAGGTIEQYAQVLLSTNEEIFWP